MVVTVLFAVSAVLISPLFAQVTELDERFLEQRKQGFWLVEFYAPWCGHCQRLEPIYNQVYMQLRHTDIIVAKVDCTKHSSVANAFNVKGFPTIKFIKGEDAYIHRGDRTKEDIIKFALRAKEPAIRRIASENKFLEIQKQHQNEVFFLYMGPEIKEVELFQKFEMTARRQLIQSYFYSGEGRILPLHVKLARMPSIMAFKDNIYIEYTGESRFSEVDSWVTQERYTGYPVVTSNTLNEMVELQKFLVITAIDRGSKKWKEVNTRYEEMSKKLALDEREIFHSQFQFALVTDGEPLNSITVSNVELPALLVYDAKSQYYYIPEQEIKDFTLKEYRQFLLDIAQDKIPPQGGTGFVQRIKRIGYDFMTTIMTIWATSRWLFLLMFGLPAVIISIVCYSICCVEPFDEEGAISDVDEGADEENKEKKVKPCQHQNKGHLKSD